MDKDMTPMSNENVHPNGMTEGERISDSKISSSMTVHKPMHEHFEMPNKTKIIVGVVAVGVVAVGVVAYLMTRKKGRKR